MKTIMISDETYDKLALIKGKKSFTELLSEMADKLRQTNKQELMKFAGIMSEDDAEELRKTIIQIRKRAKARI